MNLQEMWSRADSPCRALILPSGFNSLWDEVSHPPPRELRCAKVVSDLQTYRLRGRRSQLLLNNPFLRQHLMSPDQFVVKNNKS